MKYKLLRAKSADDLSDTVNSHIAQEWHISGNHCVTAYKNGKTVHFVYTQAVCKIESQSGSTDWVGMREWVGPDLIDILKEGSA